MVLFINTRATMQAVLGLSFIAILLSGCTFGNSASGPINSENFIKGSVYLVEEDIPSVHTQADVQVTVSTLTWKTTVTTNAVGDWRVDNPARGQLSVKAAYTSTDTVQASFYYDGEGGGYVDNIMLYTWSRKVMVTNASMKTTTVITKPVNAWDPPLDSAILITIQGTTNGRTSDLWFRWDVYGAPGSPCSEVHIPGQTAYPDQNWRFTLTKQIPYSEFRAVFGPYVKGRKVYVHARCGVHYERRTTYEDACYHPTVFEITL